MAKLISFIKFLPEISRERGREMYEREHAPLVLRLLPMIAEYRRNYFPGPFLAVGEGAGYDVMTELSFESPESLSEFWAELQGEAGPAIGADAKRFIQTDAIVTCQVEVVESIID